MTEIKQESLSGNRFVLYSTSACHLCDEAESLLQDLHSQMLELARESHFPLADERIFCIEKRDVAEDEALFEAYGKRIPVLLFESSGDQLEWPFDIQEAYQFIFPKLTFG